MPVFSAMSVKIRKDAPSISSAKMRMMTPPAIVTAKASSGLEDFKMSAAIAVTRPTPMIFANSMACLLYTSAASEEAAPENPADLQTNETAYTAPQTPEQDATYLENNAIASELLYSNKSPAERNYKQLLAKLYDNTQRYPDESEYDESYFEERIAESAAQPAYEPQQTMFQNARPRCV